MCSIKRTGIELSKVAETATFPEPVQAYLFDENSGTYLLCGRWLTFYVVGTVESSIQMKKYAESTLATDFISEDAEFAYIEGKVYLSDGKVLRRLSIDEQTRAITYTTVVGFEPLPQESKLVKLVKGLNKNELYVLGTSSLNSYEFTDSETIKRKDSLPAGLVTSANTFVDILVDGGCICVLDFLQGLYLVNGSSLNVFKNY